MKLKTYDKVANDKGGNEDKNTGFSSSPHTFPKRFNPFSAKNTENQHERVPKSCKIPPA